MMLSVSQLSKQISKKQILEDINITVESGQVLAVLGPNGAGKSTLLKILALLMKPTSGKIVINGQDAIKNPEEVKHYLGVVSHKTYLYEELTVYENLEFYGQMYQINALKKRIYDVITQLGLDFFIHEPVANLSRGMQQRLTIARAILHRPFFLLLDEPQTGLDQLAMENLYKIIGKLKSKGTAVIVVTHHFDDILLLADNLLILEKGIQVYFGLTPHDLNEIGSIYRSCIQGGGS